MAAASAQPGDVYKRQTRRCPFSRLQLLHDRADARAAGADTGTDGIDVLLGRVDGDLRAGAGLTRDGADLHGAGADLRDLQLEQALDERRMRAGAVSYTHLDVYKRQTIACTGGRCVAGRGVPRPYFFHTYRSSGQMSFSGEKTGRFSGKKFQKALAFRVFQCYNKDNL